MEVGFDDRIELTSQEIRRIEQIGQWEFLSVQSEVVADTLRKGFFTDDRLVAVYTGVPRIGIDMNRVTGEWAQDSPFASRAFVGQEFYRRSPYEGVL